MPDLPESNAQISFQRECLRWRASRQAAFLPPWASAPVQLKHNLEYVRDYNNLHVRPRFGPVTDITHLLPKTIETISLKTNTL